MKINLISQDNGVGLSVDVALLSSIFSDHDVQFVDWRSGSMRSCDVAFYLELWNPGLLRYTKRSVGIFNLEWFNWEWQNGLGQLTQLWAKSHEAYYAFQRLGLANVRFTGFAGRDLYDPDVERVESCLHVRGKSKFKGTDKVIDAWHRDPSLPKLTIISAQPLDVPGYVEVVDRCSHEELVRHMNRAMIHLCPSTSEGWGHYIVEGLSVGATVITTDASPMREHICEGGGFLLPVKSCDPYGMVLMNHVSADDLASTVRYVLGLSTNERAKIGRRARGFLDRRNKTFSMISTKAIEALCKH